MNHAHNDRLAHRILQFRVTLICFAFGVLVVAGTYYYVQRASDRLETARKHSDRQFAAALIVTDHKFRQALRIQTSLFAYSTNKQVCAFRELTIPALKSYKDAAKDPTLSTSARARNDKRITSTQHFLDSLVTVPFNFDCSTLPKNPPKASTP